MFDSPAGMPAATEPPGAALLSMLRSVEPAALSRDDALSLAQAIEGVIGWCHWLQDQAVVRVAGARPVRQAHEVSGAIVEIEDAVCDEIAAALRWSPSHADDRIRQARLLVGPLRKTHQALASGCISRSHALALVRSAERIEGASDATEAGQGRYARLCAQLEQRVLPVAELGTVAQTYRAARRALVAIGPAARPEESPAGLGVNVIDEPGGVSTLIARMRTAHAHACLTAIDSYALAPELDVPPEALIGERRALALACLVLPDVGPQGRILAPSPRPTVHLDVTISMESLLNLAQEPGEVAATRGASAHVAAHAVRDLLLASPDASLRRLVTDPISGHVVDRGRRTYRVPAGLRDVIVARDQYCRFPGCGHRARRCEIDHAQPWDVGGSTDRANLGALCKRHHQLKTFGGWQILESAVDGSCTWRSPRGRTYRHEPVAVGDLTMAHREDIRPGQPPPSAPP